MGDWLVTLAFMANEATFAVAVKTDGGKVSATISSDGQPTINVTDISVVANRLVLKYMTEAMGTPLSTVLTLTPEGQGLRANMAVMDGQYEMSGTGARQAPGAPVRATGFGGGGRGRRRATRPISRRSPRIVRARQPRRPPDSSCRRDTGWSSSRRTPT